MGLKINNMKKLIVLLVAFSLVFGAVAFARENESNDDRERIPSPSSIQEFKDIIKRGKDLFGHRREEGQVLVRPEAVGCVKTAIDTKDTAVKTAVSTLSSKTVAAIEARNTCQKAALDKTTVKEQREANRACLNTFKTTMKTAAKEAKTARDTAWRTYKTDLKTCGQMQKAAGGSTNILIEDGNDSLE